MDTNVSTLCSIPYVLSLCHGYLSDKENNDNSSND